MIPEERHVLIVGLGQIGGSLASALKHHATDGGDAWNVVGCDRDPAVTAAARACGIIDRETADAAAEAADAHFVVLATPVNEIVSLIPRIAAAAPRGAVLLDTGSTKREVVAAMDAAAAKRGVSIHCYGGHPIAGTEASGPGSWDKNLFDGKTFVLVDTASSDERSRRNVDGMIAAVGARALEMDAGAHDEALALTSHLPLLVAYGLVALANTAPVDLALLVGGSFRSATRVAAKPAAMIADILATNPEALAGAYAAFDREMRGLLASVSGATDTLCGRLDRLAEARRRLASPPNP